MLAAPAVRICLLSSSILFVLLGSGTAFAQSATSPTLALDRIEVERLLEVSPAAQVLAAVANESAAARVGQNLWQQTNPELQIFAGPRECFRDQR